MLLQQKDHDTISDPVNATFIKLGQFVSTLLHVANERVTFIFYQNQTLIKLLTYLRFQCFLWKGEVKDCMRNTCIYSLIGSVIQILQTSTQR